MKRLIFISIVLVSILIIRVSSFYDETQELPKEPITWQAIIISEPKVGSRYQTFRVSSRLKKPITVRTAPYPTYYYGEEVMIGGQIIEHTFQSGNTQLQVNYPQITNQNTDHANIFLAGRSYIISFFEQHLSPTQSGLLLGIVFGIKRGIPQEFAGNLTRVGVFHVIAASGMNVSMIAGALLPVFILFLKRQYAIILTACILVVYAYIAGFEPSIVRATIMALIAFTGQMLGRQRSGLIALFVTAYSMLLFDPANLSDIGFQLSFLATAGILLISPMLSFRKHTKTTKKDQDITQLFATDVKTTLSAQIATMPLLFIHFGTGNIFSIVANMLILWTIPPLMIIGSIAALMSFVFPFLAQLILYVSMPLLTYFESIVRMVAYLPGTISLSELPIAIWLGYYFLLLSIILFSWNKHQ